MQDVAVISYILTGVDTGWSSSINSVLIFVRSLIKKDTTNSRRTWQALKPSQALLRSGYAPTFPLPQSRRQGQEQLENKRQPLRSARMQHSKQLLLASSEAVCPCAVILSGLYPEPRPETVTFERWVNRSGLDCMPAFWGDALHLLAAAVQTR